MRKNRPKTLLGLLVLCFLPTGAIALPQSAEARITFFATCTGRLAALMVHSWITDTSQSDLYEDQYDMMEMLLDASVDNMDDPAILSLRSDARSALTLLLDAQSFGTASTWNAVRISRMHEECTDAMLM